MIDRLRAKPGGGAVAVTVGDFADVAVDGRFSLVFAVFSTLFRLQSQDAQLRCFTNMAKHLTDHGLFVIEAFTLDQTRFNHGQAVSVGRIGPDQLVLEAGTRFIPVSARFAWPSELDLMARIAGLRLRSRTANWRGDRFTSRSYGHVSVYEPDRASA